MNLQKIIQIITSRFNKLLKFLFPKTKSFKQRLKQLGYLLIAFIVMIVGTSYGIARWYATVHSHEDLKLGVTFIPKYARYLDVDPEQTLDAIIDDLGVKRFRLVSYWSEIEKEKGTYDFSDLDWQFKKIEESKGDIILSLGLRQPRWPECHMPSWAEQMNKDQWYPELKKFIEKVVERYKDSPALAGYQLENEFFMKVFGDCPDHTRERLVDEYNFVKKLDPTRDVTITRSNNWGGVPINEPTPDRFGIAVYKRVWDQNITHRYFEYPYPPWFYGYLAGLGEMMTGKDMIIHELQAEPWIPDGLDLRTSSVEEQDKSMNAKRLKSRFKYAKDTGIKTIDLWGVEWWYFRKVHYNDNSLWDVARVEFAKDR